MCAGSSSTLREKAEAIPHNGHEPGSNQREEGSKTMKHTVAIFGVLILFLTSLGIVMSGCQSNGSLAPYQPEIGNNPDNFQFQVTSVQNVTTTVEYVWQNSGTMASVNQSSAIAGGVATITLLDAGNVQRYSRSLGDNGTFGSDVGKAGALGPADSVSLDCRCTIPGIMSS